MSDAPAPKKPVNKLKLSKAQIKEGLKQIPIEVILEGSGKKSTLTHKQREFARSVALGEPKAKAYRKAYNSKGNTNTVGSEASKLASIPKVSQEIEAFRVANEAMEYLKADRLKALVLHQLTQHALNEDVPPASRIRSLELLGKSAEVGLFIDRKEVTTISTSKDAKTNLMDKLRDAMRRNAIEVDYTEADSLLAEIRPPAPSENADLTTHAPATPQNRPADRGPSMHNNLHIQTKEKEHTQSPVETFTDDTNHINNDAQVVDLQGAPPSEVSGDGVNVYSETPPVIISEEKSKKNI